jgi:hypothetical protein
LQWYSNDSYQFECQHGIKECFGNIVQACAINVFHEPVDIFNYVKCLMTEVNPIEVTNATYPVDSVSDMLRFKYRTVVGFEPLQFRCTWALKWALFAPQSDTRSREPCSFAKVPEGPYTETLQYPLGPRERSEVKASHSHRMGLMFIPLLHMSYTRDYWSAPLIECVFSGYYVR